MLKTLAVAILSINTCFAVTTIEDSNLIENRQGFFEATTNQPLNGEYKVLHSYRNETIEASFKDGRYHGAFKSYDSKNQLNNEGTYSNGVINGTWKTYGDGKIFSIGNFKNGTPDGEQIQFFPNGKKQMVSTYANGKMVLFETYFDNGTLEHRHHQVNGKEDGLYESYHKNGQVALKYIAVNGKHPDGEHKVYYEDGSLSVVENYKNGLRDGESKCFYENKNLHCHEFYKNDKYDGNIKQYRKDGTLATSIEYKDGKGNGLAKLYNKEGKLYCTATYKDDYLVGTMTQINTKTGVETKVKSCTKGDNE